MQTEVGSPLPSRAPAGPGPVRAAVESIGRSLIGFVEDVGGVVSLGARVAMLAVRPPLRVGLTFAQMDFVGVGSTLLVALTGLFTGMVFAKQSLAAFALFDAQSLVGPTVILAITRELAPVFTALMVTMRAGSAMCTELGTMRVTEQIDALDSLAVDPIKYLVYPRVVAGMLMSPVLCMVFDAAGLLGTWVIAIWVEGLSPGTFLAKSRQWVEPADVFEGLGKSVVFGLLIALIACHKGFHASGGAKGVGRATTEAMVMAAVTIFIADYLMGLVIMGWRV
jgi:phospholipid/cholesterol/gamma-HCH transport system permease protein